MASEPSVNIHSTKSGEMYLSCETLKECHSDQGQKSAYVRFTIGDLQLCDSFNSLQNSKYKWFYWDPALDYKYSAWKGKESLRLSKFLPRSSLT